MKDDIIYFDGAGKENLEKVVEVIESKISEGGYRYLVVPTSRGRSLDALIEKGIHNKIKLVAVLIHNGFLPIDKNKLSLEKRDEYRKLGIEVFQGGHSLSGIERSISRKFSGIGPVEIISETLKLFGGDGIKVAVEISVMAADAGLVPTTEEILAAGGSSGGLDTLLSLRSAHMNNFFDLNISKIFAKPLRRKVD